MILRITTADKRFLTDFKGNGFKTQCSYSFLSSFHPTYFALSYEARKLSGTFAGFPIILAAPNLSIMCQYQV